jgi:type I restriction enzyme S subunit
MITQKQVKSFQIPLPPTLEEQRAIATVLSDTDALIQALEKKIAKKKLIKKGVMQELLRPKEGWDYVRLGEISNMNSGGTPLTSNVRYYEGNIIWVSISDISGAGKYISSSSKKISEEGLTNSSARLFKPGTVLLAMYASIGKCCLATKEVSTSQAILGITTSNQLINEFLYYYLVFKVNDLINQGQQGTQSNLNKGIVEDYHIHLPNVEEQSRIAQILSDMDKEIEHLEQKLSKYQLAKQGLMQQLLTGKIRLV